MRRIAVLANGPGELWGWCRPVVKAMKDEGHHVDLFLLPCQYASGAEERLARLLGADRVVSPAGFPKEISGGKSRLDGVLQLGGDLLYGRLLASRRGSPLFSYSYGPKKGLGACRLVLTACEPMVAPIRQVAGRSSVEVVGNLVADALEMDRGAVPWEENGRLNVAVFPGSRPVIRRKALPFMTEFLACAKRLLPEAQWVVLLSPFCEPEEALLWEKAGFAVCRAGAGVALRGADVALTQPGTNTLELFHAGVPSVVAVPEVFLADVPAPTLLAPLFNLPGVGPFVKRRAFRRYIAKRGFLSWPNRLARKEVFPEITGKICPETLARRFTSYAGNTEWIESTRKALGQIDGGPSNAAVRLRERIMETLA
ncbi:MAG: cdisaccharide synthetase [Synergistales bacterium]|jgi:lipid-A-disaccharide synthase